MAWIGDPVIRSLRLAYNAAVAAHSDSARALTAALMNDNATPALIEAELSTRGQRDEARRKLHAAMAKTLEPLPEPPNKPPR